VAWRFDLGRAVLAAFAFGRTVLALLNIPLYLFHQCEEHYWPGGFKDYMNQKIHGLPNGEEKLTDTAVFRINILMVWWRLRFRRADVCPAWLWAFDYRFQPD
jgi:5'-3' exonuclease